MLKNRILDYLERYATPKTVFCRRVNISTTALRRYLNDELVFCKETEDRITDYLDKFKLWNNKTENVLIGTKPTIKEIRGKELWRMKQREEEHQ